MYALVRQPQPLAALASPADPAPADDTSAGGFRNAQLPAHAMGSGKACTNRRSPFRGHPAGVLPVSVLTEDKPLSVEAGSSPRRLAKLP
jgi:hypothetical protein